MPFVLFRFWKKNFFFSFYLQSYFNLFASSIHLSLFIQLWHMMLASFFFFYYIIFVFFFFCFFFVFFFFFFFFTMILFPTVNSLIIAFLYRKLAWTFKCLWWVCFLICGKFTLYFGGLLMRDWKMKENKKMFFKTKKKFKIN